MVKKDLVHGIAICKDCDWSCEDYSTVERSARDHVRRTGHRVKADLGYVVEYVSKRMRKRPRHSRHHPLLDSLPGFIVNTQDYFGSADAAQVNARRK